MTRSREFRKEKTLWHTVASGRFANNRAAGKPPGIDLETTSRQLHNPAASGIWLR
jgi:hypothetical protein